MSPPALILTVLVLAAEARADSLLLRNGRRAECTVLSFTDATVRIRWQGNQERDVPLADVDHIIFSPLPGEDEARRRATAGGDANPLMEYWVKRLPHLARPRSHAGEIGLAYAELLTRQPTPDRMDRALRVYAQIEQGDWSEERRARARAGRLRVLLRQGKVDEVRPEAEKLLKEAAEPRVLIELHHVLAETAAARLRALTEAHPRWEQEDDIRPDRDRLLHEALEGYLYPHVFHGAEEDLAARGLWAAAQLHLRYGDVASARACAEDLTKLYPDAPEHAAATAWLRENPAGPRPSRAAVEPDVPAEPDTPEDPKRQ